jgi:prolyl-tRNA editing enzyme YbaK/EbsC (Cys-tRNA(Pro) deacylase)
VSGTTLSPSAQKVQDALQALGFLCQVRELPNTTRSAAEAAQAISCHVAQIAKSLVFKGRHTQEPILVITSGSNRVSEEKLAALISEPVEKADAEYVRQQTGFVIGGVPPISVAKPIKTFIDRDLMQYGELYAAAGTPFAIFRTTPQDLVRMSHGEVADVKEEK